ncbi:acetyl-CoA decarbonylase/synthase complex subunit gamma [Syntrophobacter fumaroxidans]|uniref:Acetyl-CoA decarbonylase/synthase gamma subunit n=1 Tax=Syntrophobacter fumaroxidans (strain DSM 10017 / MPOB) TaxID=335543 RepID=A0LLE0_SYNFM|nr:acetyl-CoA decarbonylase/synthase complex subunit gamma [Syntrophobacter fumaroxidans]ABK18242.1 acetyl-CoA decarbonylase/synthase gamma subunit [Syntrophobacter fumaroxidans MPOB]
MALTGIQIFKLLPKTNCGECGVPTCLAFAMNLASGKAELEKCPYVSEEAKETLASESAPPIRPLTIGTGDYAVKLGGETVMFRHEKTFVNPPGFAAVVGTDEDDASVSGKIERFRQCQFDRVGLKLRPELFAVRDAGGDAGKFQGLAKKISDETGGSLILMSGNVDALKAAAGALKEKKPLIYAADASNVDALGALAKEVACPLAVKGDGSLESVIALTEKLSGMGIKDLVIDTGSRELKKVFEEQILIRRSALKNRFRPLGYPTMIVANEMAGDLMEETVIAAAFVAKYGALMVMSDFQPHSVFPLLLERLNIYTDPQRPMTAEQGIYPINNPDENSPVLVTCNFSLTYFIVSGEIESSRVPSWLCVQDTEGLSVMTAWAAGKFSGESVGTFINKCGIKDKVKHKSIIIPGYAAGISGELEEELGGWNVVVGPREASQISKFLRAFKPQ